MRCDGPRSPGAPPILKRAERPERHRGCEDRSPRCHSVISLERTRHDPGIVLRFPAA